MATPHIAIASGGRKLYLWDFSCVNNRHCVVCNACRTEYTEDALHELAAHDGRTNGTYRYGVTIDLFVYCCTPPPPLAPKFRAVRIRPPSLATVDPLVPSQTPQSDEPPAAEPEREAPAVCRWCKGTREITVNFKTKPCEECAQADPPGAVEPTTDSWRAMDEFIDRAMVVTGYDHRTKTVQLTSVDVDEVENTPQDGDLSRAVEGVLRRQEIRVWDDIMVQWIKHLDMRGV